MLLEVRSVPVWKHDEQRGSITMQHLPVGFHFFGKSHEMFATPGSVLGMAFNDWKCYFSSQWPRVFEYDFHSWRVPSISKQRDRKSFHKRILPVDFTHDSRHFSSSSATCRKSHRRHLQSAPVLLCICYQLLGLANVDKNPAFVTHIQKQNAPW